MGKCFVLGCSQAAGWNMVNHVTDFEKTRKRFYDRKTYGYHHSYPVKIGHGWGYHEPHNHAVVSGSTDAMLRIFKEIASSISDQDIVMACWTNGSRSEYYDTDRQSWIPLMVRQQVNFPVFEKSTIALQGVPDDLLTSPKYEAIYRDWVLSFDHDSSRKRLITNINLLNQLASERGITVCNIFSFCHDRLQDHDHEEIARWWWPIGTTESLETFADTRGYVSIDGHGHYDESVHTAFAGWVLEHASKRP